ncbi:MAG: RNA-binding protein [Haloglomus sp.]
MASVPFHYVELRTFCYATEDENRVADALGHFLPERDDDDPRDPPEIERSETEGFNGDRILVLSTRLERADDVRHVLSVLSAADEFDGVLEELDDRVDDNCAFFLSLDKQAAFGGRTELGEGITFRAKIEAYPAKRETAVENAREAFADLADAGAD